MDKNSRDGSLLRSAQNHQKETKSAAATTSSDFVLQWGNRKRLRCMKVQNKNINHKSNNNDSADSVAVQRIPVRVDRRVVRSDLNKDSGNQPATTNTANSNGYLNLRQRGTSPSHRNLRNPESTIAMRERSNGLRGMASPDKVGAHDKRGSAHVNHHNHHQNSKTNNNDDASNNHHHHGVGGGSASSETAHDSKKGGGGGSSSGSDAIPMVWPPKFVIGLTNKEKEEDFMAIKGSKLPQRPKKRAKFIQRTLNLISPGAWLCDLSLERYEVREKKVTKKRPRGLKAMGNMESESE
ncbi:PREDICTED: uncharacterized protein DDB_G0283357-like [Nicotiana attenuata]|uniref:uncharacterized protein DDB_G0283357-like n=1 Tax=Nicotiana attenuata TaxID=49451 RepID=UPI00090545BC|nr:PREDICTED: uncharacterized protein DDB_G0283357-like [Nicotiana attenuata]